MTALHDGRNAAGRGVQRPRRDDAADGLPRRAPVLPEDRAAAGHAGKLECGQNHAGGSASDAALPPKPETAGTAVVLRPAGRVRGDCCINGGCGGAEESVSVEGIISNTI